MSPRAILILMLIPGLSPLGCVHARQVTWRLTKPDEMREAIWEHIPMGAEASAAQEFMESEGFHCTVRRGAEFCERNGWTKDAIVRRHEGIDFIECKRIQGEGHFLMARIWTVALVLEDDIVNDVLVAHYIDGP